MKKTFKLIILLIMILPMIVFAESSNYDNSIGKANNYIKSDKYSDRNKYLIISKNAPYSFSNDGISNTNSKFETGGMLNASEYNLSLMNNRSYLATGIEYWTMTGNASSHYYVENYLKTKEENLRSNTRVTEFVQKSIKVTGSGTYTNPWEFDKRPLVTIRTNSEVYGLIEGQKEYSKYAEGESGSYHVTFTLKPQLGYEYVGHDGCNMTTTGNVRKEAVYRIENVINDMDCIARFDVRTFKLSLKSDDAYSKNPAPATIYFKYLNGWSVNSSISPKVNQNSKILTTLPTRSGYSFEGYKYNSTLVIDKNGNVAQPNNSKIFNGTDINDVDLKAQWKICPVGTYSDADHATCQTCPSGYTSREGANSINKCYIKVNAGYYLSEKNKTTTAACAKGYFKEEHEVYYGSTSSCSQCPAGYRDGTAVSNKTAENKCLRNVEAGYYIASAKATSNTVCAKGYYNGAHTVTYGSTSSCTQCPAGYRDGTAVENKTAQNKCLRNVDAGYYIASANATTNTVCANGYYKEGHTVTYGSTSSCTQCPAGYRDGKEVNNKTKESMCLRNVPAGYRIASVKATTNTECENGTYKTAHGVTYGSLSSCTTCPAGYRDGTAFATKTSEDKCLKNVTAGYYVASSKNKDASTCPNGYYKGSHTVSYGGTSSCTQCPAGYRDGTAVSNKTAENKCLRSVPGGNYVASARATSNSQCSTGYYKEAHGVTYGSVSSCSQCPSGYTTDGGGKSARNQCRYWSNCATGHNTCSGGTVYYNCSDCKTGSNTCKYGCDTCGGGTYDCNCKRTCATCSYCVSYKTVSYDCSYYQQPSADHGWCTGESCYVPKTCTKQVCQETGYRDCYCYNKCQTCTHPTYNCRCSSCKTGSNTCKYGCDSYWSDCASGENTCKAGWVYAS